MNRQKLFLILSCLFLPFTSFSQGFQITPPKLDFDGRQLSISYDFIDGSQSDIFYMWVEMEKKNGEPIRMRSISGDVGDNIKAGKNTQITWIPEKDSIFLNEVVFVEVKAEKYLSSEQLFNNFRIAVINNCNLKPQFGEIKDIGDEGGDFIFILK
jgi:hypothetical protein